MKSLFLLLPVGLLPLTTFLGHPPTDQIDCLGKAREAYITHWQEACTKQKDADADCVLPVTIADPIHASYDAQVADCK